MDLFTLEYETTTVFQKIRHQSYSAMAPHPSVLQCHGTTSQNSEPKCTSTKAQKVACWLHFARNSVLDHL